MLKFFFKVFFFLNSYFYNKSKNSFLIDSKLILILDHTLSSGTQLFTQRKDFYFLPYFALTIQNIKNVLKLKFSSQGSYFFPLFLSTPKLKICGLWESFIRENKLVGAGERGWIFKEWQKVYINTKIFLLGRNLVEHFFSGTFPLLKFSFKKILSFVLLKTGTYSCDYRAEANETQLLMTGIACSEPGLREQ